MPDLAFLNGKILKIEDAFVPLEDRGHQFGDAVYEFVESFDYNIFCLDEHLNRLKYSMEQLDFPELQLFEIKENIINMFNESGYARAGLYLQVSRGVEPRSHSYTNQVPVQISMTVRDFEQLDTSVNEIGIKVRTCKDYRWGMCHVKTVQLLPAALEMHKAKAAGMGDTVFISEDGIVREGTCTNTFMVKNDTLFTHPLDNHILPGITRDVIINKICKSKNLKIEERFFSLDEYYDADEAFLCSTVLKIQPIIEVDGKAIGKGVPGEMTRTIQAAYDALAYNL